MNKKNWIIIGISSFLTLIIVLGLGLGLGLGLKKEDDSIIAPSGIYDYKYDPLYLGNYLDDEGELVSSPLFSYSSMWMIPYMFALISPYNAGGLDWKDRKGEAQYIENGSVWPYGVNHSRDYVFDDFGDEFYMFLIKDFFWDNILNSGEIEHMSIDNVLVLSDKDLFFHTYSEDNYGNIPNIVDLPNSQQGLGNTYYVEIDDAYINNYYGMHELFLDSLIMDMSAFFNAQSLNNDIDPEKNYIYFSIYNLYFADQLDIIPRAEANAGDLKILEFKFDYNFMQWDLYIEDFRYAFNPINATIDYIEIDNFSISISSDKTNQCIGVYIYDGISRPKNYYNHFYQSDWWINNTEAAIFHINSPLIEISGDIYVEIDTPWDIGDPLPDNEEGNFIPIELSSKCLY